MIETETRGPVRVVTLNRPDKANAVTHGMLTELSEIAELSAKDETNKVLIFSGSGKVFSAGADLEAARAGLATDPVWERLSGAIASAPCLTIAALNGTAAGGSLGMVLACDLRIATPAANIFYPVMKLGFLPQPSDPKRLAALVGPARAKLILMAGQKISADEALNIGLVDHLSDTPLETAIGLAEDAVTASREHVQAIKSMIP